MSPTLAGLKAARGNGRRRVRKTQDDTTKLVIGYLRGELMQEQATGLGLGGTGGGYSGGAPCLGVSPSTPSTATEVSVSPCSPDLRPGLSEGPSPLWMLPKPAVLMVSKIDRLGRELCFDLALLTPLAERAGWSIIALNCDFDMSTASGKAMASMMSLFAALEKDSASAESRARGTPGREEGPGRLARQAVSGHRCRPCAAGRATRSGPVLAGRGRGYER